MSHSGGQAGEDGASALSRQDAPAPRSPVGRTLCHRPLCTIVVTHHNYAHLLEGALLSLLDQTHDGWECMVIDDASRPEERRRAEAIVRGLADRRISFFANERRLGQIDTFFAGLSRTSGEFVTLLDPDDRLAPTYLEEMLQAHLNGAIFCPIVSCDQKLVRADGALLTGTWKGCGGKESVNAPRRIEEGGSKGCALLYFSPKDPRWLWSSSSGLMVRRAALNLLVPSRPLDYSAADTYVVHGAHFLGGTIFQPKALVYRGVHARNHYLSDNIISMQQTMRRAGGPGRAMECRQAVVEAMFHNGVLNCFSEKYLAGVLARHFKRGEAASFRKTCPEAYRLWQLGRPLHRALKRVFPWAWPRRATGTG
jgi:glycosyltransferase involved in cell wall biosynthesis